MDRERPTTRKLRFVSEHFSTHLLRADWEVAKAVDAKTEAALIKRALALLPKAGAVVLSDYAKGVLTPKLIRAVIDRANKLGKPVVVDPKGADFSIYRGATVITPNRRELAEATRHAGRDIDDDRRGGHARWRSRQKRGGAGDLQRGWHDATSARRQAGACAGLFGEGARRVGRGRHGRGRARRDAGGRRGFRIRDARRQCRGVRRGRQERHRDRHGGRASRAHPAARRARAPKKRSCSTGASSMRGWRRGARRTFAWASPTACSICYIPATSGCWRRRAPAVIGWW